MRRFYGTGPAGLVGNDDVGQMSAWLVFAMLGFYPAQPFSGTYVTGRPLVEAAELRVGKGRTVSITGRGETPQWDGADLPAREIGHAALVAGGTLRWR